MGEIVEFPSNGTTASGYLAVPEAGTGIPVVVIQEWWGLVAHIKEVCDRFAAEGFVALAPDLYHGESTTEPDEAGKLLMAMNLPRAGRDLGGAVDKVAEVAGSDRVGVTGFCMGGGLTMILAAQRPDKVKAAVPWYGFFAWPDSEPDWTPMEASLLAFVAGNDDYFTPDQAGQLEKKLQDLGKEARFKVIPEVEHAFFNDHRPEVHHPEASEACWQEMLDFFRQKLA